MIYKILNAGKYLMLKKSLSLILMTTVSVMAFSCTTTEISNYTPDEFISKNAGNIEDLTEIMTDSSTVDVTDMMVSYSCSKETFPGYLSFNKADTVVSPGQKGFKIRMVPQKISLKEITNLRYTYTRFNTEKTLLCTGVALAVLIVIGIIAYLLNPPKFTLFEIHNN